MNVVITGSTKGIGLALAQEFLRYGDQVVVSSRSPERVESAVQQLKGEFPEGKILGIPCDVSLNDDLEALAKFAQQQLGTVEIWINNAGSTGDENKALVDSDPDALETVIRTNLLGSLLGCRAALADHPRRRTGSGPPRTRPLFRGSIPEIRREPRPAPDLEPTQRVHRSQA